MKTIILFSVLVSSSVFARGGGGGSVHVGGYVKSNGTYVQTHERSAPNNTVYDNYSTKGNVNPYTGKEGTKTYNDNYNYNSGISNSNSQENSENNEQDN